MSGKHLQMHTLLLDASLFLYKFKNLSPAILLGIPRLYHVFKGI